MVEILKKAYVWNKTLMTSIFLNSFTDFLKPEIFIFF